MAVLVGTSEAQYNLTAWVDQRKDKCVVVRLTLSRTDPDVYRALVGGESLLLVSLWCYLQAFLKKPHEAVLGSIRTAMSFTAVKLDQHLGTSRNCSARTLIPA